MHDRRRHVADSACHHQQGNALQDMIAAPFQPFELLGLRLENRIIVSPMRTYFGARPRSPRHDRQRRSRPCAYGGGDGHAASACRTEGVDLGAMGGLCPRSAPAGPRRDRSRRAPGTGRRLSAAGHGRSRHGSVGYDLCRGRAPRPGSQLFLVAIQPPRGRVRWRSREPDALSAGGHRGRARGTADQKPLACRISSADGVG